MTVAVVLKPDLTTTISRGILRLAGTFAGLALATTLFHLLPEDALTQLLLVGLFTFLLRYVGPANYGVFSIAISGLIVFLIAETGVPPAEVVFQRAVNTGIGGMFALIAYALWPTWERASVPDVLAAMLDASRDYFRAVVLRFQRNDAATADELDATRLAWRQANSSAQASVDRYASEPGALNERVVLLTSILASSRLTVRTTMSVEAAIASADPQPMSEAWQTLCHDVEFTLYFLAAELRGSASGEYFPALREDHRRLLEEGTGAGPLNEYLLTESDRLAVSLNTLREQVLRFAVGR